MLYISFNSVVKTLEFCFYVIKIKEMTCVNNKIIFFLSLIMEKPIKKYLYYYGKILLINIIKRNIY